MSLEGILRDIRNDIDSITETTGVDNHVRRFMTFAKVVGSMDDDAFDLAVAELDKSWDSLTEAERIEAAQRIETLWRTD